MRRKPQKPDKEGMTAKLNSEPKLLVQLHDLTLWYLDRTNRFPKNRRVTLGDKIDNLLIEMLTTANLASMKSAKTSFLSKLNDDLETLRVLTRLCLNLKCLEIRQYEFVSGHIDEIGRQLGGWLKSLNAR